MYYSLIGHVVFWVLIIWGWVVDGFTPAVRLTFVALWIAGYFLCPYLPYGNWWFAPYVAILDVVMVLIILRDNVRLL